VRIDQPAQVKEGVNSYSRFVFVSHAITDPRSQHPFGQRYLCAAGKPDDQNCRLGPPQMADHFNFDAIEGMESIADLCCVQIMSSTGRPYATAGPPICLKLELICARFRFC